MNTNVTLPIISEDEAFNLIVSFARKTAKAGTIVKISEVIANFLSENRSPNNTGGMVTYRIDLRTNNSPFFCAAWRLCMKGILAQTPTTVELQYANYVSAGEAFYITEYGATWLKSIPEYDITPTDHSRFAQLLAQHKFRLGNGFYARTQEALHSYRSQNYLACCAMCGAAAESITLALAIEKKGNEEDILKEYGSSGGRGKIERYLLANQNSHFTRNLPNYTSLLNDWRDIAAHGDAPQIGEEESFKALLLLVRYAKFADEHWNNMK